MRERGFASLKQAAHGMHISTILQLDGTLARRIAPQSGSGARAMLAAQDYGTCCQGSPRVKGPPTQRT